MATYYCYGQIRHIEYISAEQGLSQNEVTNILQDSKGFMWFATRGGINRYDGYEFVQFNSGVYEEYSLTNPSIECIFEDSNANLWIGTKSGGLNFFDYAKEKFIHIQHFGVDSQLIVDNRIISINETADANILIGTWSDGLYVLDLLNNRFESYLEDTRIYSILPQNDEILWLGTNKGLFKMYTKDFSCEKIELKKSVEITEIIFGKNKQHIWLAGWEAGLTRLDLKTLKCENFSLNPKDPKLKSSENSTYTLLLDTNGTLWVGTWNGGLYIFNDEQKAFTKFEISPHNENEPNGNFDIILDIFEDNDKNIWIGTDSGGLVFVGAVNLFKAISLKANPDCGLESFYITSMYETNDSTLWVGTRGGGLYKTKNKEIFERIPITNETFESSIIKHIFHIKDDVLLVCTGQDLYYLDLSTHHELKPVDEVLLSGIKKIITSLKVENHLLLGTQQNGLYFIKNYFTENSELIHFYPGNDPVLKNERITFIEKDNDGKIWFGSYKGVYCFNIETETISNIVINGDEVLNKEMIYCYAQTNDKSIWLGTPRGVIKLNRTGDTNYIAEFFYSEKKFPFNYVRHIFPDNENNIWLSASSGLTKMNIKDNSLLTFDRSDGLIGLNFSEDIGFKGQDGKMYFGGANGFSYFDPAQMEMTKNIPPLVFTKFRIFNEEVKPLQKFGRKVVFEKSICLNPSIELTHKEREFSIEFAALNYSVSKKNSYKYKLEGYDAEWIPAGSKRLATYSNLQGGSYTFKVKGANNNYVWNEDALALSINIKSAPWKTWYAVLLYIVFIFSLVLIITRNSIKQVRLSTSLEMEKLKNKQEHELNELKLRFFTNISHEFRTPLTMILGPVKEVLHANPNNKKLKVAYKNSKRLMSLVNQLLEFRRVETDNISLKVTQNNIVDFINEICLSFEEMAMINDIQFKKEINIDTQSLWFDIEKLEIVVNNIIYNAFKYAGSGSEVNISVTETEQKVNFCISDNGPGIEEVEIDKIFERFYQSKKNKSYGSSGIGLNLARTLIELHAGSILVHSVPNKKTKFTIELLKGKSHFNDDAFLNRQIFKPSTASKNRFFAQLKLQADKKQNDKKELSILIVEDNAEIRGYLHSLFVKSFNVYEAENGADGYDMALEKNISMIISDVMMPEMDGMEMCRLLKSNVLTSHIPVILLTAKTASQFRIEGLEHGADAYFSKPFDPDELKMQVYSILESRKKAQEKFSKTVLLEPSELKIIPKEEVFLKKVIKCVEDNIENSEFTSEDLAIQVGMSTASLYRKLKLVVGQSSNELIRSVRLKRAAQLLSMPDSTISEITYMVGFNDVKYFRKCFQKQYDQTPSQYRNGKLQ